MDWDVESHMKRQIGDYLICLLVEEVCFFIVKVDENFEMSDVVNIKFLKKLMLQ